MSLELIIFLIVAAVAIFAAAFMLVSRNAVHSALFLVTNMICLAFFYLMLNAPFLAMVQITVYAGAIMVLFMFVIMLLGAEKLSEEPTKYRWLPLAGVALTTLFLITAFVAVVQGNVGALKPIAHTPQVRVVHAGAGTPPVDVYLNNDKLVSGVSYQQNTDYREVKAGDYNALVFAHKVDNSPIDPSKDAPVLAVPLHLASDTMTTLVATADRLITVPEDLTNISGEDHFRYTAVNAFPGSATANLLSLNPSDVKDVKIAAPGLHYGDVSRVAALPAGNYEFAWDLGGQRVLALPNERVNANTHQLFILAPALAPGATTATPTLIRLTDHTEWAFGGPQSIGDRLFSAFLLPFELVSLLLLAAMVGAIILTREEIIKRERIRRVVSGNIKHFNRAAIPNALSITPANPEPTSDSAAD